MDNIIKKEFFKLINNKSGDIYNKFKYCENNLDEDELRNMEVFLLDISKFFTIDEEIEFLQNNRYSNNYLVKSWYKDYYEQERSFYIFDLKDNKFVDIHHLMNDDYENLLNIESFGSDLNDSCPHILYFGYDDYLKLKNKINNSFKKMNEILTFQKFINLSQ